MPMLAVSQASMSSTQRRIQGVGGYAVAKFAEKEIPAVIDGEEEFCGARDIHAAEYKTGFRTCKPSEPRSGDARPESDVVE